jgi:penicillin-binding protein 1A
LSGRRGLKVVKDYVDAAVWSSIYLRTWYLILAAVAVAGIVLVSTLWFVYRDDLPSIEEIYNIEPPLVTTIYSADRDVLQKYHYQNRILVPYSELPPHLIQALVATEDAHFFDHWGVDWRGVARAVLRNVVGGFGSQGGSTITQQLARMLFLNREVTLARKIKEAFTAIRIESTYSKQEILEMYLNHYFFGNRSYVIETAARSYFNKNTQSLTLEEAATLVAVLNAPGRYSPISQPERALARRNYVLQRMHNEGFISARLADSLRTLPLELDLSQNVPGEAPYFTEMVRQHLIDKLGRKKFYEGGLAVHTTLDTRLQRIAERALLEQLDSIQARVERRFRSDDPAYTIEYYDSVGDSIAHRYKEIQAAFVAIDNETGDILALVGGKDFSEWKWNRAVQALRQPGSAFKPFVYTAAVHAGFHPSDILYDTPIVLTIPGAKEWRPHNFDSKFDGPMTLREGLARSRNLIAIKLLQRVSPQRVIFYATRMGISSPLRPYPTLAIGTSEVNLLELTSAYTTFPNLGIHIEPRFIAKVEDRYGNVLEENRVPDKEVVMTPEAAYMMVSLMQSTFDHPRGTGRGARGRGFYRPAGGKTGTSDTFCDNWFIGYTPQITAGVWVGFDDKTSIGRNQTGATNALPIWTEFMIAAHDSLAVDDFSEPDGIEHAVVCLESGKLATPYCTETAEDIFLRAFPITESCPIHGGGTLPNRVSPDQDTTETLTRF